jgi:hypothetical protein
LTGGKSLNPVKQVLDILGESLQALRYISLGYSHFPDNEIAKITKSSTNNGIYCDRIKFKSPKSPEIGFLPQPKNPK